MNSKTKLEYQYYFPHIPFTHFVFYKVTSVNKTYKIVRSSLLSRKSA